jgi:hypothetical protein
LCRGSNQPWHVWLFTRLQEIKNIPESRREWLLDKFSFEARRTRSAKNYKLWKDTNHAIDLSTIDMISKVDYMHNNPVQASLVFNPDEYVYSSACDYTGSKGLGRGYSKSV